MNSETKLQQLESLNFRLKNLKKEQQELEKQFEQEAVIRISQEFKQQFEKDLGIKEVEIKAKFLVKGFKAVIFSKGILWGTSKFRREYYTTTPEYFHESFALEKKTKQESKFLSYFRQKTNAQALNKIVNTNAFRKPKEHLAKTELIANLRDSKLNSVVEELFCSKFITGMKIVCENPHSAGLTLKICNKMAYTKLIEVTSYSDQEVKMFLSDDVKGEFYTMTRSDFQSMLVSLHHAHRETFLKAASLLQNKLNIVNKISSL